MRQKRPDSQLTINRLDVAICLLLLLSIFAVYYQVIDFDFTNYDGPGYVTENPHVRAGLTLHGIRWALTGVVLGNWMPVTLLSHMLDCTLFGLRSGMHHLVNVIWHALATLLLFAVLRRTTGAPALSGFVAAVFAVHPLHVQSVAWVAERKDVLSAFFFFLGLYCYSLYVERPSRGRYLMVLGVFCLGLMSKPMLVTFPFVLLLFDAWPLHRFEWPKVLWEKLPIFALAAASSIVTYFVQHSAGAVESIPLALRLQNALESYVTYIGQMFWPTRLAVFYPFPHSIAAWQSGIALLLILGVSALVIAARQTRPYLAVGWFWYVGTLVPVIGLVQVGAQSHADRYTYIPLVGLSIMLAWGAAEIAAKWQPAKWKWIKPVMIAAAVICCADVCLALTSKEVAHWRNSETLFQHAIDVTTGNWVAESNLGESLMRQAGRRSDALDHLQAALRIRPDDVEANNNLGLCLFDAGLYQEAVPHFEAALRVKPGAAQPLNNLGLCLMNTGRLEDAIPYFQAALRAEPDSPDIHLNLGMTLSQIPGDNVKAIAQLEAALRLQPNYAEAHFALGLLLATLGRDREAISHLEAGQIIHPDPAIAETLDGLLKKQAR